MGAAAAAAAATIASHLYPASLVNSATRTYAFTAYGSDAFAQIYGLEQKITWTLYEKHSYILRD